MTALTCCRKSYRRCINSPHNAQEMCSAAALTTELLTGYNFYLDILNRKPQRLLWVPQFTQTLKNQQRTWGQVTIVHLNSEYGSICITSIALIIN